LEPNFGVKLAAFSDKIGRGCGVLPLFCWVYVIFRFFVPPGPILAPFGLDFGGSGAPFLRFSGDHFP